MSEDQNSQKLGTFRGCGKSILNACSARGGSLDNGSISNGFRQPIATAALHKATAFDARGVSRLAQNRGPSHHWWI